MASIRTAIYSHFRNLSTLIALIGDRFYPTGEAPKTVQLPYATFQKVAGAHARHLGGGLGIASPRYQFTAWAADPAVAEKIGDLFRETLDNFTGMLGTAGNAVDVRGAFLEDDDAAAIPPFDASNVGVHGLRLDFTIFHTESVTPAQVS